MGIQIRQLAVAAVDYQLKCSCPFNFVKVLLFTLNIFLIISTDMEVREV